MFSKIFRKDTSRVNVLLPISNMYASEEPFYIIKLRIRNQVKESPLITLKYKIWICAISQMENGPQAWFQNLNCCVNRCSGQPTPADIALFPVNADIKSTIITFQSSGFCRRKAWIGVLPKESGYVPKLMSWRTDAAYSQNQCFFFSVLYMFTRWNTLLWRNQNI